MTKLFTRRRAVAVAVALAATVPALVTAVARFLDCGDTPCMAFWMIAIPACAVVVVINAGVACLVGDDERHMRIAGYIVAVPLLLVDVVMWLIVSGA